MKNSSKRCMTLNSKISLCLTWSRWPKKLKLMSPNESNSSRSSSIKSSKWINSKKLGPKLSKPFRCYQVINRSVLLLWLKFFKWFTKNEESDWLISIINHKMKTKNGSWMTFMTNFTSTPKTKRSRNSVKWPTKLQEPYDLPHLNHRI